MSHPLHHSISSQQKWGGHVDDYLPIHDWFDGTRVYFRDMRHRSMRHHVEGFSWAEEVFGTHITNKDGQKVAVRDIGEQHCREDVAFVPTVKDWLNHMKFMHGLDMVGKGRLHISQSKDDVIEGNCQLSRKRWGGKDEDYSPIHHWFEETRDFYQDNRYRILRHHAEGVYWAEQRFGIYFINSEGRMVTVRAIGEQHVEETVGRIPTIREYLENMAIQDWMFNPGDGKFVLKEIREKKLDYVRVGE